MQTGKGEFYGGTSGLVIPISKRDFQPPFNNCSRLQYYAANLNSIEINSSFYKLPMPSTVSKWADSVPENFKFTFKLWRNITHNKQLAFNAKDVTRFMDVISRGVSKKGCILVQFPPKVTIAQTEQLTHLLSLLTQANKTQQWHVAVEFRHRSWYNDEVYELLSSFDAGMVLQDMPASPSPQVITAAGFVYLRFHGPEGNYKGSYADELLYEYAQYVSEWQEEGRDVYVYFNNTAGDAWNNLCTLADYVRQL
ncbi:DUF72 domain-containing protein [Mucilaginibacter xinganensis]|uniref:Uncharacterized conserved protein YecE, DUF72 family n=1 Tax=Mucilaginibacter xinganensis TaxID=1234841 RepID=A0A223NZ11_9SPHI|nr:DUF72 domain-containing protein [Mucilaginibacter xinganensis]ASU35092.1 Uncharacterized conserved protein YecE, DUF72 family [Mucilaginibacter xinganensis]